MDYIGSQLKLHEAMAKLKSKGIDIEFNMCDDWITIVIRDNGEELYRGCAWDYPLSQEELDEARLELGRR